MKNLTNHVLMAAPSMPDLRFAKSVIYIARHDDKGAFGFVINHPLAVNMLGIFEDLSISVQPAHKNVYTDAPVLDGGPLNPEVGFVLHTGQATWQSSVAVAENICFTTSKDILLAIASNNSVAHYQMCLGHANWYPNQLEQEIEQGDWFYTIANSELLFRTPIDQRWQQANDMLGIRSDWLVNDIGHS